jgi:hypothetical protein
VSSTCSRPLPPRPAIRALSPAVNDPTTGVQAIDRLSDLLAITGNRLDPTGLRADSAGTVRIKRKLRDFDRLLVLSLTEVIRYGADAPQVVRRLRAVLDELESTLPPERHAAIARQRSLLDAATSAALPAPFTAVASTADRRPGLNGPRQLSHVPHLSALQPPSPPRPGARRLNWPSLITGMPSAGTRRVITRHGRMRRTANGAIVDRWRRLPIR